MAEQVPTIDDVLACPKTWQRARLNMDFWKPILRPICQRHNLLTEVVPFQAGSAAVFSSGSTVIKVYHPADLEDCQREICTLELIGNQINVAVPKVVATGKERGLSYLVMTKLPGIPMIECWQDIPAAERVELLEKLGVTTRKLHEIETPEDSILFVDTEAFITEQKKSAHERQRVHKLPSPWLEQINGFLDSVDLIDVKSALLHTEIMRDHVLVSQQGNKWELSGIFDFAESMTLPVEYEFASVGLFVSQGNSQLLRSFLLAYGYEESELDIELSKRLLVYSLLHRYANLSWYLEIMPPKTGEESLENLAKRWFSL